MSIIQVQGGGGRVASDRTSFVGVRVPPEIKIMVKKSAKMDKDIVRKLLKRMLLCTLYFAVLTLWAFLLSLWFKLWILCSATVHLQ